MAKMIKVERCGHCKYVEVSSTAEQSHKCVIEFDETHGYREIDDLLKIPFWCKLPDYPEEGK